MMELDYSDLPDVNEKQSSPTLDFSDLPDDKTAQKQSFVDAQLTTKAITPQQALQAKQAASQFNIPFINAVQNPDIVADRKIVEGNTYDDLATRAPKTATFLQDPVNAAIAKDDHDSLAKVEGFWATLKALPNAIAEGAKGAYWQDENKIYFDKFVNPFRKELVKKPAFLGERPTHAILNTTQELQLQKSKKGMARYGEATKRLSDNTALDFAQYTGYGIGQLAIMGKNIVNAPFNNAAAGAGVALAGATMAASTVLPEINALAKAAKVAKKSLKYGAIAFVGADSFKQNSNEAHKLYVGLKDETGKPLPKDIVQTAALAAGGINALLDVTSVVALSAMFAPAVKNALQAMGKEKVKAKIGDMLARESTRKLIVKWGATAGGVAIGEGAIEGAQDLIKNMGREIAQDYATENRGNAEFKSPTLTEPLRGKDGEIIEPSYGDSAAENFWMGAKATLFMGMAGAGINTHAQMTLNRDIASFKNERTNLDLMNQAVTESPSMNLDPSLRTRLMNHLGLDGDDQELYMDANKTRDLFQSFEGVTDPIEEVRKMFGDETAKNFAEALNTSSDFAVPADAFVTEVMGTKLYDSVKEFTRVNPHSLTQEDIANFEAKQQLFAKQLAETERNIKENGMTDPVKRVYDDVYGQVKGIDHNWLSDKDAQDYAHIHAVAAATRSAKLFGGDHSHAWDMYTPYNLSIVNEFKRIGDLKRGKSDIELDPLLDEMRAGLNKPKQESIYGKSLMDSLRAMGLQDMSGELAARDVDKELKPFQRKMIRADGMDLDRAAEWAQQNGYIDNIDTNELLNAMDEELFGSPVFSKTIQNPELVDRQNRINDMQARFERMGVDIHSKTNEELRDIIRGDNTLNQEDVSIDVLVSSLENKYEGLKLDISSKGSYLTLSRIVVPKSLRSNGVGSIVMVEITKWADRNSKIIKLSPSKDFGGNKSRLFDFYKRFGFIENKGKNKDYEIFETMYRLPSSPNTLFQEEQKQIDAVRAQYEGTGQWMKAPNGEPTKLNEMQWLQVRTPNFKAWFGDWEGDAKNASKVVDANGEPLVVYHGSKADFDTFSHEFIGSNGTMEGKGFYFTDKRSIANNYGNNGKVYEVFLNIKDSLSYDSVTLNKQKLSKFIKYIDPKGDDFLSNYGDVDYEGYQKVMNQAVKSLLDGSESDVDMLHDILNSSGLNIEKYLGDIKKSLGRDGIFVENPTWGDGQKIFVAFDPTQIKSATGNTGEFSASNPNILYQSGIDLSQDFTIPSEGMTVLHGTDNKNLTLDDINIIRTGQKQAKKGRSYGGFYTTFEDNQSHAQRYSTDNGNREGVVYSVKIKPDTKVKALSSDITRLSDTDIAQWVSEGFGAITGRDARGRQEFVVIDKGVIESIDKQNRMPIYRVDSQAFDKNIVKPHGLYVSIPSDTSTFNSPHKEVGNASFSGYATPKNPLNVDSVKIQHKRGNNYPMETSAGVSALKQLVDTKLFDSLIKADKAELTATIKEQFPDIDTSQYHDAYELLEVLGAQLAKQDGYDAIIQKVEGDPMNEMVILDNSIIGDLDKQLNQGVRGYLNIGANREMTITMTGTANFSTFLHESGHLWLEMMRDDLQHPNVTEAMKADWDILSKWFSDYSVTALKEIQGDVKSLERKIASLKSKATLSDKQSKELAELEYNLESNKQALAYIEQNPNALKDVTADFGDSIESQRIRNVLTKPYHEQFARGMEAYFREGKAPSIALQSAFANFANWLQNVIYKTMQMLGVNLTDDVRGVMDRMFATDAEIQQAKEIQDIKPIFGGEIPAEMSEADRILYVRLLAESEAEAKRKLLAEVLQSQRQEQEQKYQDRLAEIRKEIEHNLNVQPSQIAIHFLRTGKFREGAEPLFPVEPVKLDKAALVDAFGEGYLKNLPKGSYTVKNGIHFDELAEALGFTSGRQMLQDMANDPLKNETKRNQYLDEQSKAQMKEESPELISNQQMTVEAQKAIHSDKRAEVLINEMGNLEKLSGKNATPAQLLYAYAEKILSLKPVQDIRPAIYQRAEAAANRKTIAHVAKGEYAEALESHQTSLLNHYLFSIALKNEADYKKRLVHIKRYMKTSVRKAIASAGADAYLVIVGEDALPTKYTSKSEAQKEADNIPNAYVTTQNTYLETIDAVLANYDIKKMPVWAISLAEAMDGFVEQLNESGIPDADIQTLPSKKNIHRLSYADFVQVDNLLTIIERVATGSKELNTIRGRMELADIIGEMKQSSAGVTSHTIKMSRHKHALDKLKDGWNEFVEYQTNVDVYNSIMDGEQEQGIFHDVFLVPSRHADTQEQLMKTEMELKLTAIFKPVYEEFTKNHILGGWNIKNIFKREIDAFMGHSIYIESLDSYESVQTIMGWAQLYGHQGGRDAMFHPDSVHQLTEEGVLEGIGKLTKTQLDAVEKIVVLNNSYWSRIEALDKRTKGYAAPKVVALPYMVGDRMMTGGYSRLKYDGKDDMKVMFQEMADGLKNVGSQKNSKTNAGSTNKRVGSGGKPPRYDFSVIHENLLEVIHDLTHREFVINAQKVIKDKEFQRLVSEKINPQAARQYQLWINRRGVPDTLPTHGIERFLGFVNNSSTIMFLGINTFNSLQNMTGLVVGSTIVGEKYMLMGTAKLASSPVAIYDFVNELSPMMANRAKSFGSRDAARTLQADSSFTGKNKWVAEAAFIGQRLIQEVVDKVVWFGAYQKAMDGNVEGIDVLDQQRAIQYADRTIEQTQSGAGGYSQANIFEKNELVRLFTLLGGYMNRMYNLQRVVHNKLKYKPITKRVFSEMLAAFYIMLLPALITAYMRAGKDDDDDWWEWAEKNKVIGQLVSYPVSFFVLSRPFASKLLNPQYDFSLSPSEGFFSKLADGIVSSEKMVGNLFSEDEDDVEIKRRDVKNVINSAGYLLHLPTQGIMKSGEPLYDYLNGDYTPADNAELTRSILLSKPK